MGDSKFTVNIPIFEIISKASIGTLMPANIYQILLSCNSSVFIYHLKPLLLFSKRPQISLGSLFLFRKYLSDLDFGPKIK